MVNGRENIEGTSNDLMPRCPVCRSFNVSQEWYLGNMYYKCRQCGYSFKWRPR